MKIAVPKEMFSGENWIPLLPESAAKLVKREAEVAVEAGIGESIRIDDAAYRAAGAKIVKDREKLLADADMILRLRKPDLKEVGLLKEGSVHISYLDPWNEKALIKKLASAGISAISMEFIPRTTLAQKMDALSSQASLAGYNAVIVAAGKLDKILPMMMTPAGTITPSRVFIIGAGVAGLQAIATAKRLGARVEAFDTRPVVEEQVKSLGAKFVKIDLGETGQTKDGYAKQLTKAQIEKQRKLMAKHCELADIVITTAQVFGRKAPLIVTKEMIRNMKPGSLLIDLAVESGGNVEGAKPDKEVDIGGVRIIGITNMSGEAASSASQMYSNNLVNLIEHFWDDEKKEFNLDLEDEIIQGCLITHDKKIVNEAIKKLYEGGK
jgi:NAD(P) transhydrogenase subunit alpha